LAKQKAYLTQILEEEENKAKVSKKRRLSSNIQ